MSHLPQTNPFGRSDMPFDDIPDVSAPVLDQSVSDSHALYLGDSCEVIKGIPDNSVHFCLFSPPFSSQYTYSSSERDMGNCESDEEFFEHFSFLIPELLRITVPGRLAALHVKNLPMFKTRYGVTGLRDFRGETIRAMQAGGWVYHSEVCIWTDPVLEMQRTKVQRLLHKQVCADASLSGQGLAEYLVVFRKWDGLGAASGSPDPVRHEGGFAEYHGENAPKADGKSNYSIDVWQRYASPVWFDIRRTDVLNVAVARADQDEKHLAPLQLEVVRRAVHLWTNPGDVVFSPFAGIGSELVGALDLGRRAVGIELKPEYFRQAVKNIQVLEAKGRQLSLLGA